MKVSSLAGKPPELGMLVNVPKLITAYYASCLILPSRRNGLHSERQGIAVRRSRRLSTNG
jgi:hypothetical protein